MEQSQLLLAAQRAGSGGTTGATGEAGAVPATRPTQKNNITATAPESTVQGEIFTLLCNFSQGILAAFKTPGPSLKHAALVGEQRVAEPRFGVEMEEMVHPSVGRYERPGCLLSAVSLQGWPGEACKGTLTGTLAGIRSAVLPRAREDHQNPGPHPLTSLLGNKEKSYTQGTYSVC